MAIVYPDSDGKPIADNTKQFRWIAKLFNNISALSRQEANVFVAADFFWYAVEGHPEIRIAPDVLVAFGRPKGDRGSYKQWEENNVPPTVVFEVLSPANTVVEMIDKFTFYEDRGVEEYYIYDPDSNYLVAYLRQGEMLRRVRSVDGFISPRLGIRFDLSGPEMVVFHPDGERFLTFEELEADRARQHQRRLAAEQRIDQAEQRLAQAQRANQAEQRANQAEQRADEVQQRTARMAELGRKARRQQASADELKELERLETDTFS